MAQMTRVAFYLARLIAATYKTYQSVTESRGGLSCIMVQLERVLIVCTSEGVLGDTDVPTGVW